jgi:anaphase-promoting complex subunit 1
MYLTDFLSQYFDLFFSTVIVNMTHIEVPQNITHWPLFHNGVAASLAINRHACDMGDNWIRSQILKNNDITNEQAGFLYGLGLIGHFKNLPKSLIYSLLQKANELTMMASLLGICVSK